MIRVLRADDHSLVREGPSRLLGSRGDIEIVGVAANGKEAVEQVKRRGRPDVGIIDVSMWGMDGIEATREILAGCTETRVVMLSIYDTPDYVQHAIGAGARGYVSKDEAAEELGGDK